MDGFSISTSIADMDLTVIHGFIADSYWAKGIPRETLAKAMAHSLCFGVFTDAGEQIGFARMITDRATYGYLADVFILEDFRGQGLSSWLMATIMAHPDLQGLRRINLATRDAHALYEKFGFSALSSPEDLMEILKPDIYQK